jgi:osmoprotectant transport system permease protein
MTEALAVLPALLSAHLQLTLVALSVSLLVSLPGGILLARSPALRGPALAAAGVLQTLPSLALLALMVPLFAGVHLVAARLGLDTPVLGFLPAVTALSLYGILPILRNTVTGLAGVDATLVEAARGLGMTEGQVLRQVQLPLAAPVLFAGIRTAAVWIVGTATLATPVGQRCLGDLIFGGLQTRTWSSVVVGCLAAAALALVLDGLLGGLERARSGRVRAWLGGVGATVLLGVALTPAAVEAVRPEQPTVTVGAKGFTEQFILARLMARRLERAGYRVRIREGLGSTIIFDALGEGGVDVYVDYSGTVWANHLGRSDTRPADEVLETLGRWVADTHEAELLGPLGFENAYAMAVRRERAGDRGWQTVGDLAGASDLRIGADYEFFQRPEWEALRAAYDLTPTARRTFDPAFLYEAVDRDEVDVIAAFSSDGRIAAYDLVTLADPEQALPPYDAILLADGDLPEPARRALAPLVGGVTLARMREANRRVDEEGASPDAAAAWLDRAIGE